jgi:hypothetical protein
LGENVPKPGFEIFETEMLEHAFTGAMCDVASERWVCKEERNALGELCDVSVWH